MKKIVSILIMIFIYFSSICVAYADDIDLSKMSYDELVALKDRIDFVIWNSEEWQEVEVPQGVWEVGVDIPSGKWTIKAKPTASTAIYVGQSTKDGGTDVAGCYASEYIKDKDSTKYNANSDVSTWTIELEDGIFVKISSGPALFTPYSGKPSLGFKSGLNTDNSESTDTNSVSAVPEVEQSTQSNSADSSYHSDALDEALYIANSFERTQQQAFNYIDSWGQ